MILAIVLVLVLFLLCILLIPFNICLNLKLKGLKIEGFFKLTWMKIRLLKRTFPDDKKEEIEKKDMKRQKPDLKRLPKIISLLYESYPYLIDIFKVLMKSADFKRLYIKLNLGFNSSYDTAVASGFIYSIMPLINLIPKLSFLFEPDFERECIEAKLNLEINMILWPIVAKSLNAITKKPVRSLLNELRKFRS